MVYIWVYDGSCILRGVRNDIKRILTTSIKWKSVHKIVITLKDR